MEELPLTFESIIFTQARMVKTFLGVHKWPTFRRQCVPIPHGVGSLSPAQPYPSAQSLLEDYLIMSIIQLTALWSSCFMVYSGKELSGGSCPNSAVMCSCKAWITIKQPPAPVFIPSYAMWRSIRSQQHHFLPCSAPKPGSTSLFLHSLGDDLSHHYNFSKPI